MNAKITVVAVMVASLAAGTMLVGAAYAAPRVVTGPTRAPAGIVRPAVTASTFDAPTIDEMNAFMDRYRASDGAIDVSRMHNDIAAGKVTPPCQGATTPSVDAPANNGRRTVRPNSSSMMGLTI